MNNSWKEKSDKVLELIKKVSIKYGGDDIDWLRDYSQEVILKYIHELQIAIKCFESLLG